MCQCKLTPRHSPMTRWQVSKWVGAAQVPRHNIRWPRHLVSRALPPAGHVQEQITAPWSQLWQPQGLQLMSPCPHAPAHSVRYGWSRPWLWLCLSAARPWGAAAEGRLGVPDPCTAPLPEQQNFKAPVPPPPPPPPSYQASDATVPLVGTGSQSPSILQAQVNPSHARQTTLSAHPFFPPVCPQHSPDLGSSSGHAPVRSCQDSSHHTAPGNS